jgi:hypothetical protein
MDEKDIIKKYMAHLGKKSGQAQKQKYTPQQLSEMKRKAAQVRWKKLSTDKG